MKHLKYLLAAVIVGSAFFGVAHSQTVSPNLWKTNVPSSTIAPINSNLQVPCANIQGGCSGGVPNSTSTATSSIQNFNGMLSIPYNYATVGCFGSATTTDLGSCVNLAYSLLPSGGGQIDIPSIGVIPYTTPIVEGNQANAKPVMLYCSSGGGFYGGGTILYYTPISGSALTVNNIGYSGGGYGITNCGFNGPAGIGNIGSSTIGSTIGVDLGGTGAQGTAGAFGFTMTGVHISGFGTCLYIGSNMSFMIFQDGTINKCGRDIDSPSVSGANGENMRIVNSTIADCNSPTGQSISAYCMDVQESGNVQWTLTNDSYDDAQIYSNQYGGTANIWNITDLHDEDPNTGQACYDRILTQPTAAGAQATVFNIKGGDMMEDITTGCPEFVSFGGKLVLDGTTGDINNNVSVPDTYYAVPLNNSTVMSWTGLSNQGFNTSNNLNTGFTYVIGTTPGAAIDGLEVGSSSPVYYASTSTFNCSSCGGSGGIASSSPYTSGNLPLINGSGALTNSLISQTVPSATSTIAYDAASAWTTGASVTSTSASITVGSGSNRMLFVFTLTTSGTASTTSVTDNGTGMTLVASTAADASRTLAMYDLPNPASGASTITINVATSEAVVQLGGVSYSGVLQSATLDASATTATSTGITSLTTSLTTIANNDWSVNLTRFGNGSNGNTAGASSTVRVVSGNGNTSIADTNGGLSTPGTQAMTITNSNGSSGGYSIMAAFAPAPAVTANAVNINGTVSATGFTATTTAALSFIANFDSIYYFPSPTQLAAGALCGSVSNVTDAGVCVNDFYSLGSANGSSTEIVVPPYSYNYSTGIAVSTLGERLVLSCVGGSGTNFSYTGTGTGLTLNAGAAGLNGYNTHVANYGTDGCSFTGPNANGTTTGVIFGGSHGAEGAVVQGGTINGFGTDVTYASGSWKTTLSLDNIMNAQTLWKWPGTLTDSGEGNIVENTNFHDNTATSSASNFVNCVISQGGGYFDFEDDQWDDCQLVNAGTGFMKVVNPHFENAAADTASSSYTFIVNSNGNNANSVMSVVNPTFVQDASNTAPTYFIQNSSTIYVTDTGILNNGPAQVVNTFIQNTGSGSYSVCNISNQNNAFKFFFNGNDNNPVFSGGQLLGCSQAITGNWPTGWFSIGNNIYATEDGGFLQAEISTVGLGEGTTTVSATHSSAITGSNNYGSITTTGDLTTTTVTFNGTWNFKPSCGAGIASGTPVAVGAFGNTTSVAITAASAMPTGTIVSYWCYGNPN